MIYIVFTKKEIEDEFYETSRIEDNLDEDGLSILVQSLLTGDDFFEVAVYDESGKLLINVQDKKRISAIDKRELVKLKNSRIGIYDINELMGAMGKFQKSIKDATKAAKKFGKENKHLFAH